MTMICTLLLAQLAAGHAQLWRHEEHTELRIRQPIIFQTLHQVTTGRAEGARQG
jgi:hypothetical protein